MLWLLLALQVATPTRPYHAIRIAQFPTSTFTHVETTGQVILVKQEADGDWHLRVSDGRRFVVAEVIPALPVTPIPMKGQCVRVRGIRRYDNAQGHLWWEIHPVEQLEVIPCAP